MRFKDPQTAGRASVQVQRERRMDGERPPRFDVPVGTVLHTLLWTSHVAGHSTKIEVVQADRRNQILVRVFGRTSHAHGMDWLTRHLRRRLVVRWIKDT